MNQQVLKPAIHEFLIVSARYLDVPLDNIPMHEVSWRDNGNRGVKQNDQEVGYATNHV
jgi:hypothetical protein